VRLLKEGAELSWGPREVTCVYCKSVLEADQDDLITWDDICGFYEEYCVRVGIKCPQCETKLSFNLGIPSPLEVQLRKKHEERKKGFQ
jgi:hypothetical protein